MSTLLLVEDNAILATTLVRFLNAQAKLRVAAIAPSAEAALEEVRRVAFDLALVDVSLPGISGIDFVGVLREQYPEVKCLMLSGHQEADYVGRALAAGAKGYVLKSDPMAILEGVQHVLEGKVYLSKDLRRKPSN